VCARACVCVCVCVYLYICTRQIMYTYKESSVITAILLLLEKFTDRPRYITFFSQRLLFQLVSFTLKFSLCKLSPQYVHTYLPIACNTLNNDMNRFRADCFLINAISARLHYAFSSNKLKQDAKQFARRFFFISLRKHCLRVCRAYSRILKVIFYYNVHICNVIEIESWERRKIFKYQLL